MSTRVFLSSTTADLKPFRDAVRERLAAHRDFDPIEGEQPLIPVVMEDFPASPYDPAAASCRRVAECNLFVGIYGWCYGTVLPGRQRSIIEEEYRYARSLGRPCFCFRIDDGDTALPREPAGDRRHRLKRLLHEIEQRHGTKRFRSAEELAAAVVASLQDRLPRSRCRASADACSVLETVADVWLKIDHGLFQGQELPVAARWSPALIDHPHGALPGAPQPDRSVGDDVLDAYQHTDGDLLICGAPGTGKSYALLRLLRILHDRAWNEVSEPLPVYLRLWRWSPSERDLAVWIRRQLGGRDYKIAAATAWKWLPSARGGLRARIVERLLGVFDRSDPERRSLVLLLDGIDDLEGVHRARFADTFNRFRAGHRARVVITSRTADYQALIAPRASARRSVEHRLALRGAIEIGALTTTHVDAFLDRAAPALDALRHALATEPAWRALARTPLMLNVMAIAYAHRPLPDPLRRNEPATLQRALWNDYLARTLGMLERKRPSAPPLSREARARRLLDLEHWLARQLTGHRWREFFPVELQPTWLYGAAWRWLYMLATRLLAVSLLLLASAVATGWDLRHPMLLALVFGLGLGIADAARLEVEIGAPRWRGRRLLRLGHAGLVALGYLAVLAALSADDTFVLLIGAPIALLAIAAAARRSRRREIDLLDRPLPSASQALRWLPAVAAGTAAAWAATTSWPLATIAGGTLTIAGILLSFRKRRLDPAAHPDRGIQRSLASALLMSALAAALIAVFLSAIALGGGLAAGAALDDVAHAGRRALPFLVLTGLVFGGWAAIQHGVLRLLLRATVGLPLNLRTAFDDAVAQTVLQRRGQGYQLLHDSLRDHLSELDHRQRSDILRRAFSNERPAPPAA